ncbi:MAG: hypothetical protein JWO67_4827 [Streptosporangiaceae bacterium]|nr:hypothetical protein [Streptosporangiaceae bacterium]
MARRRRPERQTLTDEVPEWFWQFKWQDWGLPRKASGEPVDLAAVAAAREVWRAAGTEWLDERGLVSWTHSRITWGKYQRLCREQPSRVLQRPQ